MKHEIKLYIIGSFIEGECSCGKRYEWSELEKMIPCERIKQNNNIEARIIKYLYDRICNKYPYRKSKLYLITPKYWIDRIKFHFRYSKYFKWIRKIINYEYY